MIRRMLSLGLLLAAVLAAFPSAAQADRTGRISRLLKYDLAVSNLVGSDDALTFVLTGTLHVDDADQAAAGWNALRANLDIDPACWAGQQMTIGRLPLEPTARRPKFIAKGSTNPDGSFAFPFVAAKAGRYVAVLRPLESTLADPDACLLIGYSNIVTITAPDTIDLPTS